MRKFNFPQLLLGVLFIVLSTMPTHAQAVYGSVSGTVTDQSGAAVPNAIVTVTSAERQTADVVQTNDDGLYVKDRLIPGIYQVRVEAPNFKQALLQSVTINVDTSTNADVTLETGQVSETVEVSGEGQLLKTDRADVATTFTSREVTELPLLDRNFTRLILLTPGTQQQTWQHAASENPQGSIQTIVNGQTFSGTGFQLDGTENRDPILGVIVINPTLESIGETKFTSSNYDAEFGQAISGVATVQTKSGTNDFRGSAFFFRANDLLRARNPFNQAIPDPITGKFIPDTLKSEFGGSIGGPIVKNRVFFFNDYQGRRSKIGGSRRVTVPTVLARTGNLSEYGRRIFDPLSGTEFAGGIIPTARLSPQAQALLQLIPLPNLPGTTDNYVAGGSEPYDTNAYNVRIDGRVSDAFNIFGRYSIQKFAIDGPTALGQGGGRELVSLGGLSNVQNQSVAIGFDYSLSPTTIIDVRFGYFKYDVAVLPFDFGTTPAADAGIPGLNLDDTFTSGLPEGIVGVPGGEFRFGTGLGTNRSNSPLTEIEDQTQIVGNLTKIIGNHTAKFGVDVRFANNLRVPSDSHRSGQLSFNGDRTGRAGIDNSGNGLATFLIGDVSQFQRYVSTSVTAEESQIRHFYYAQDTWRATPKFTLAYGLRADVINPQRLNEPGNGGFIDLATGEVRVAGVGDIDLAGNVENKVNFAPRIGVAYQLNDSTVIRAGFGRSYDIGVFGSVFGHTVTQNLPVLAVQQLNTSSGQAVFNLAQGPPAFTNFFGLSAPPNQGGVPLAAIPANGRFFLPNGVSTRAVAERQTLPRVNAFNVTLQREFSRNTSVEVAYVGNRGAQVFVGDNPDLNINQPSIAAPIVAANGSISFPDRNARRPFFQRFGWTQDVLLYGGYGATNSYDALQTKLTKRFSNGYSLLAHYTLQRTRNNAGEYFSIDPDVNRGPADFDRTHNFVFANVLDLPFGRNKRFLSDIPRGLDYLIGGFQFNSTTTIQSGLPFNVGYDNFASGVSDVGPNRPDLIGDPFENVPEGRFFNPAAFAAPAPGTFGNLRRNSLRGPKYIRTDASLFKKFRLTETVETEFRIEVENLFNNVNLGNPDGFIGSFGSGGALNLSGGAGRITSTAFFGNDRQRNFQFAAKIKF